MHLEATMESKGLKDFQQGQQAESESRYNDAIRFYHSSLELDPDFRPALVALGTVYSRAKKPEKAVLFFQKALQLKISDSILFNLGSEYFKLDALDESRKTLTRALKENPRLLKAHLLLAYVYGKKKEYSSSIQYFRNALKLDPTSRPAKLGLVVSLSENKDYEAALKALSLFDSSKIESDSVLRNLKASLLMQTGQLKESLNEYSRLTRESPEYSSFTEHLNDARKAGETEYNQMFGKIDNRIKERSDRVRNLMTGRKEGKRDPVQKEDLKDLVDLSFLHLFKGDQERALRFLFQAKKMKDEDSKKG